jgi:hypothetical protein
MTIKKLTPETYKEYFEDLATKNKAIAHNAATNNQFFCVDMDEVEQDTFNYGGCDINNWTMVLEDMTGRFSGDDSEHLQVTTFGAFLILKKCPLDDRAAERQIMDDAFKIGKQFLAKMKLDQKQYNGISNDNVMSRFKPASVTFQKMKAIFDNAFGYRFEFETGKGEILKHDAADWNV